MVLMGISLECSWYPWFDVHSQVDWSALDFPRSLGLKRTSLSMLCATYYSQAHLYVLILEFQKAYSISSSTPPSKVHLMFLGWDLWFTRQLNIWEIYNIPLRIPSSSSPRDTKYPFWISWIYVLLWVDRWCCKHEKNVSAHILSLYERSSWRRWSMEVLILETCCSWIS